MLGTVLLIVAAVLVALFALLAVWTLFVTRKIDAALPPQGDWVEVAGGRIHYVAMGPEDAAGPPIVMMHGIMGQVRHFGYGFAEAMAKDHRVYLIDRPGWGHSTLNGPHAPLSRQADMVAAALAKLGVQKPVLVGHSMGGALSLAIALRHPGLPRALALIAPLTQPIDKLVDIFRSLQVPARLRTFIAWTVSVPIGARKALDNGILAFSPDPIPADFGIKGGGLLAMRPSGFQSGAFEVATALPEIRALQARYGELKLPVSIIYGRGDYILEPALHGEKTAAEIPGAQLLLVEGGHMLPVVHVEKTEEWLRAAIAALPE